MGGSALCFGVLSDMCVDVEVVRPYPGQPWPPSWHREVLIIALVGLCIGLPLVGLSRRRASAWLGFAGKIMLISWSCIALLQGATVIVKGESWLRDSRIGQEGHYILAFLTLLVPWLSQGGEDEPPEFNPP
jgi:hypothetical protein